MAREDIKTALIQQTGKQKYRTSITYMDGETAGETFETFDEANDWLIAQEVKVTPEKAASDMTPEDAEEINSNVNTTMPPQANIASQ